MRKRSGVPRIAPWSKRARRIAMATLSAGALTGLAATGSSSAATSGSHAKAVQTLIIGTSSSTVSAYSAAYMIGASDGCYRRQGVKVELRQMNTPEELLVGLTHGEVNVGIPGSDQFLSIVQTLRKTGQGNPLIAFYEYTYPGRYGLAVSPSSKIHSYADLVGKTVGVDVLTDSSKPFLDYLVKSVGADPSKVNVIATGKGTSPLVALKNGDVQALYLNDNQAGQILATGAKLRFITINGSRPVVNAGGIIFMTARSTMKSDSALLKAMTRCTAEGDVFTEANPTASAYMMLRMFPTLGVPGESETQKIATIEMSLKMRNVSLHSPDASVPWGKMDKAEFSNDLTLLLNEPATALKVQNYFTNRFIKYANDFSASKVQNQAMRFKVPGESGPVSTATVPPNAP